MLEKLNSKSWALAVTSLLILTDLVLNVSIGLRTEGKILENPMIPELLVVYNPEPRSLNPDILDGLFGLKAVIQAREQARVKQLAEANEHDLGVQELVDKEQVLVVGEDQFRLFGVSSAGMHRYAIFSVSTSAENTDLIELELGGTLELLDGSAILILERVSMQSVSLRVVYVESEEHADIELALFKVVE
jgi:hypothetical protein